MNGSGAHSNVTPFVVPWGNAHLLGWVTLGRELKLIFPSIHGGVLS
jgi:hypothetical protein